MNKLPLTPSICPDHVKDLLLFSQLIEVLQTPDAPIHLKELASQGVVIALETFHNKNQSELEN